MARTMTPASPTNYKALEPLLRQAQKLGKLDASEGGRAKVLPQVLDTLRSKLTLDPVARGMVMSMYRAGFDTAELRQD